MIPVSAATFCCACLAIFVIIEGLIFLNASGNPTQDLDYVIVLGARVKKDGISRSLKERLDTAIQYSEENPETVFVLSGGKGPDEPVTEAEAMRDYMVYNGISPDRILLETHSTSTVENIAYSRLVMEEDRAKRKNRQEQKSETIMFSGSDIVMAPDKPTQVGILTSDFHIFRAKKIAKEWGIKDAAGIPSPSDPVLFVHQCVREALAIFKDGDRKYVDWQKGQTMSRIEALEAYQVIQQRDIQEMNSKGWVLEHKQTGARVFLMENDDENKVFSIGFRTPPADSTGLPHILEHSVLCGSEKFPVKGSFCRTGKGLFKYLFKCNDLSG